MNWIELQAMFKDCKISGEKIIVNSNLAKTITFIKDHFGFDTFKEITAVDNNDGSYELMYRLYSAENSEDVIISIIANDTAESISDIFDGAVADEKEIYDMFGIKFTGNSELKRLYMPESWEGHPLKKDYEQKDERLSWNE